MDYLFFSAFWLTDALVPVEVWPELERAECLARGAALKWASVVFCRPEHLERLGQYRKRESQRTASIHSRLKVSSGHYFTSIRMPLKSICPTKSARKVICSLAFFLSQLYSPIWKVSTGVLVNCERHELSWEKCLMTCIRLTWSPGKILKK